MSFVPSAAVRRASVLAAVLGLLLFVLFPGALPAGAAAVTPVLQFASGPFTIRGQIKGLDGRPVGAGIPVTIYPMLPQPGMDLYNLHYKIPAYDNRLTYTDAQGRFELTNVVLYPQVAHKMYRLWAATDGYEPYADQYPFVAACTKLDLGKQLQNELWIDLEAEPAGALRIIATRRDGTPFSGTKAISIASGFFQETFTAVFKDGVYVRPGVLASSKDVPWSRVILFDDPDGSVPTKRALDAGKAIDMSRLIDDGPIILDVQTAFRANEFTTIRVTLP
ncbi:MAG: hypothetical protein ACM3RP_00870 [Chitinophagales bacterium]